MPIQLSRFDDAQRALLAVAESGGSVREVLDSVASCLAGESPFRPWAAVIVQREHGLSVAVASAWASPAETERLLRALAARAAVPVGEVEQLTGWLRAFAAVPGGGPGERAFIVLEAPAVEPSSADDLLQVARMLAISVGPRCLRPPALFSPAVSSADLLFEQVGVGLIISDLSGRIRRANPAAASLLQRDLDKLVGLHWSQYTHPDDVPGMQVLFTEVLMGVRASLRAERRFLTPAGKVVPGVSTTSLLYDPERRPVNVLTVVESFAVQQHIQAGHERSLTRFRLAFEQSFLGMSDASPQGVIRAVNRRFCDLLGYSESELVGRHWAEFTIPEDIEPNRVASQRAVAAGEPNFIIEKRYRCKDGRALWAKTHVSIIRDAAGNVESLFAIVEDLTETRSLTEQLVQTAKMESLGRLAGGIAHDFGNLLTAIANGTVMARQDLIARIGPAAGPAISYLNQAVNAAESASRLTGQLLAFAKRQPLRPRAVSMPAVACRVLEIVSRLISPNVKVTLDTGPADLWRVRGDANQFEQILLNLALNARDAIDPPGVISISLANERIARHRASAPGVPPGEWVRLSVTDSGRGIDPEELSSVFEPFFTTKQHGFGLGLANVFAIAKQWGGHVHAASKLGRGTRFDIWLPKAESELIDSDDAESHPVATPGPTPPSVATAATLPLALIVDDQPEVREMLRVVFERSGYRPVLAADGREAIELIRRHTAELRAGGVLITDQRLPRCTGIEVALACRKAAPNAIIVVCSGDVSALEGDAEQHRLRLLSKPFGPAQLLAAVRAGIPAAR